MFGLHASAFPFKMNQSVLRGPLMQVLALSRPAPPRSAACRKANNPSSNSLRNLPCQAPVEIATLLVLRKDRWGDTERLAVTLMTSQETFHDRLYTLSTQLRINPLSA